MIAISMRLKATALWTIVNRWNNLEEWIILEQHDEVIYILVDPRSELEKARYVNM